MRSSPARSAAGGAFAAGPYRESVVVTNPSVVITQPSIVVNVTGQRSATGCVNEVVSADPLDYEAGVRAAARQGPDPLRRYIWRTRMVYNFYYGDFAPMLG
jgi:predicted RNase H-like nuclease